MNLPTEVRKAKRQSPSSMVIYGKPKCGKTEISAALTRSNNFLLLELEPNGADFVDAVVVEAKNVREIYEIGKTIKEAGKPYDGIIVDTVTKLEDLILPLAASLYKKTPMGASWTGKDVRELPRGAGYLYLRQAFFQVMNEIGTWSNHTIFLGHLADKMIEKNGEEVSAKELDLTGKIKSITCAQVDAIAYCYREDNKTILNFNASEEDVVGSRCKHLRGKEIVIAESTDDSIEFNWKQIFIK
jgi:hypothetical protein